MWAVAINGAKAIANDRKTRILTVTLGNFVMHRWREVEWYRRAVDWLKAGLCPNNHGVNRS
jgi:hypothetical protein